MQELEQLEKDFRKALEGVCGERDRIVQDQLAKEEQRLCVVCQVNSVGWPDVLSPLISRGRFYRNGADAAVEPREFPAKGWLLFANNHRDRGVGGVGSGRGALV